MLSQNKVTILVIIFTIGVIVDIGSIFFLTQTMPLRGQITDLEDEISSLKTEITKHVSSSNESKTNYMSFLRKGLHGENGSLVTAEIVFPIEGVLIQDIWLETKCPTVVLLKRTTVRMAVSTEQ